jgi:hypothetical protein
MIFIYLYISHKRGFKSQISTHKKEIHHKGVTKMTIIILGSPYDANIMIEQEIDRTN